MLAIVSTHPIQYQTPVWQALAADGRVPFEVWYLTDFGTKPALDSEFGTTFRWDIDTLSGYPHRFLDTVPGAAPANFWDCRVRESLSERVRAAGAKVVWIQGWQVAGYWQAAYAAKRAGAQLWLRAESNDLAPVSAAKQIVKRAVLGRLFSKVDRFLCIGTANRRLYSEFGVPADRMIAAPYAVDNERFARQANALRPKRAELRRALGIDDDAFCVLFCGKFIAKKRPMDIVEAARILLAKHASLNVHLLFVGAGELGEALHGACNVAHDADRTGGSDRQPGSHEMVRASFAGFLNQTEISLAYVAADCLVLPSDYGETWGLVVNEAMASGLPCIVSDACGCAEDLAGPDWSYPLGDVAALAGRLERLHARLPLTPKTPRSFQDTVSAVVATYANHVRA